MKQILLMILLMFSMGWCSSIVVKNISELEQKRRAEWVEISGVVHKKKEKVFLKDTTGKVNLKLLRTSKSEERLLWNSFESGDTLSIIGTYSSPGNQPTISLLRVKRDTTTLFRQYFHNISEKPLPDSIANTSLNRLKMDYYRSYNKRAIAQFSIAGSAFVVSSSLVGIAMSYSEDDGFGGAVIGMTGLGFLVTTIRHSVFGGLWARRKNLTPDLESANGPIQLGMEIRPSRENVGLYLVGRF